MSPKLRPSYQSRWPYLLANFRSHSSTFEELGLFMSPMAPAEVEGVWGCSINLRLFPRSREVGTLRSSLGASDLSRGIVRQVSGSGSALPSCHASRGRGSWGLYGRPSGHPDLSRGIVRQVGGSGNALPTCDAFRGRGSLGLYGRPSGHLDLSRGIVRQVGAPLSCNTFRGQGSLELYGRASRHPDLGRGIWGSQTTQG